MKKKGGLFNKPAGESDTIWNNLSMGVSDEIICEGCGIVHERLSPDESSRIIDQVLGLQIVESCCEYVSQIGTMTVPHLGITRLNVNYCFVCGRKIER